MTWVWGYCTGKEASEIKNAAGSQKPHLLLLPKKVSGQLSPEVTRGEPRASIYNRTKSRDEAWYGEGGVTHWWCQQRTVPLSLCRRKSFGRTEPLTSLMAPEKQPDHLWPQAVRRKNGVSKLQATWLPHQPIAQWFHPEERSGWPWSTVKGISEESECINFHSSNRSSCYTYYRYTYISYMYGIYLIPSHLKIWISAIFLYLCIFIHSQL